MQEHRIVRFEIPLDSEDPRGVYTWEQTPTGFSLDLANEEANGMRKAFGARTDWSERDVTDEYFIGHTRIENTIYSPGLGTIDLEGGPDGSCVAIPRKNFERVLCTLHDFVLEKKEGPAFTARCIEILTDRIERHVQASREQGLIPLLDGIEMVRLLRAVVNRDVMHRSNQSAPALRVKQARDGATVSLWSPDFHWPALRTEDQPARFAVRGVAMEDEHPDSGEAVHDLDTIDGWTLGPIVVDTCETARAAAEKFFAAPSAWTVCIVRSETQEAVYMRTKDGIETRPEWVFERGGPLVCPKPERSDGEHAFVETSNEFSAEQPGHPAACRGVDAWLLCHHCDAWADYNYGEGVGEAIDDALWIVNGGEAVGVDYTDDV